MAKKLSNPIRMCILCRKRYEQNILLRFQCIERDVISYTKKGRSLYLCNVCIDSKKLPKSLARVCKSGELEKLVTQLKEIVVNER